jgi:lysophospholipase L1-like esterase
MKMRLIIIMVLALALGLAGACGGGGGGGGNTLGPDDIIIMYGNSITHRGPWAGLFPNNTILNYGVDGDTTSGMLSRLNTALAQNPKVICVMGGINDIIRGVSVSTAFNNLRQILIRSKAAGVIVVMESTLHTGSGYPNSYTINQKVVQLNAQLSAMTRAQGEIWLDLNSSMAKDGYLQTQYLLSDNLHLNSDGYVVWSERLNNALP